jgi:hypothetical protein
VLIYSGAHLSSGRAVFETSGGEHDHRAVCEMVRRRPDQRRRPGFTATDLNHNTGTQTVEQGAEVILRMALIGDDGPTGTFQGGAGPLPW